MLNYIAYDQAHIWHPYSPSPAAIDPLLVTANEGAYLTIVDKQGGSHQVIDAMSSWWSAAFGHRHPQLVAAAHNQIDTLSHVMFGGLTHPPAVHAAQRLLELSPAGLAKVFFADSGSVAVEVALKMCLHYQRGIGHPERTTFLTWRKGYHGDTFATMSLCDPDTGMHSLWTQQLTPTIFAPAPPAHGASEEAIDCYLAEVAELITDKVAGIIVEPIVQGAGGMRFHDAAVLRGMHQLCKNQGLVFIADEIATGFYRTGKTFACEHAGITPDILCVGKALTGGMLSFAATLCTNEIAHGINAPASGGALMHGPTFMANPLAASIAAATLELVATGDWADKVAAIAAQLKQELAPLKDLDQVNEVRVLGAIGVVELKNTVDMATAYQVALSHKVWLRPFGKLLYTMPPFICTPEEIHHICTAITTIVQEH
ncbi:adenosylmethionine-8-amino-7-oxononanoate aminotransferase [Corynebacterium kutscheri]|uniref:Adenosylmethionine-8-amino-7-oxononanoate aminotransferase n=1 Tax=Corynebacterium kutscheri TaxID=35755 RepID=A0A0F6TCC7_9CORY|nr:adenosylmethionine--8-amino-7-oxononanoate transaminase [Corynebacterium kutscheri]AKE40284.1 adenosylmethionine-8-amino-7-oxononanoate transaminase [Corynebacterium kutscheri]VEH10676.1 adenosylmethionine-8-amino-7-oxononanoate aminotransferase [Corynebacterium kutscheri]VEH81411.1 adenosylmethionine-8-amino-7-oxononanoate aminotransferase [Corynebacterium kutscheri]